ncbi:TIGR03668 family PPOX class F420-dependent oxidoreductase [Egicoccus sp. AB-alg2]|uniref:TIGR03668 family PPOX class F420-dependent oxidoreductase n=1 Tax=Egicoccus sp. AB-alg2 TaxID=3242693 RepID=UPI00359CBEFC
MEAEEARRRFAAARVARLATVAPDGMPHLVPVVHAVEGDRVHFVVDHKRKRTTRLRRLENLRHDPRCALLVDHYDEDWSRLWWVRADGSAEIVDAPAADHPGLSLLVQRYRAYRESVPPGPLVVVTVRRWSGWLASP